MACLRADASGLRPSLVRIVKEASSWGTEDEAMLKPKNVRSGKCLSNIERTEERRRSRPREREDNPEGGRAAYCNLLLSNTLRVVSEPSPTRRLRRCVATVCEGYFANRVLSSLPSSPRSPGRRMNLNTKALSPASGV